MQQQVVLSGMTDQDVLGRGSAAMLKTPASLYNAYLLLLQEVLPLIHVVRVF